MNDEKIKSPQEAQTKPLNEGQAPDANVDENGHCIMDQTGEMARPDSGEPCNDGRAAD